MKILFNTLKIKPIHIVLCLLIFVLGACKTTIKNERKPNVKPNVLFISIDDLRPELNAYGITYIKSPNIDLLAKESILFEKAYCNVPVCGASRASIMTGLYPLSNRFTNYGSRIDKDAPDIVSLAETFKSNGYFTTNLGKTLHHPNDGLKGWSEPPYRPDYPNSLGQQELWRDYQSIENAQTKNQNLPLGGVGPAWEAANVADTIYYDGKTTKLALQKLEELKSNNEPFFFSLGFIRPHLPFNAPKKYWDMYSEEEIALAENPFMPKNAPREAEFNSSELRSYTNIPDDNKPLLDDKAYKLKHGYAACVSFIDAQLGMVIQKLKSLGLYDNTIIVIWGDHGWSLGEHSQWGKHTNFNNSLRVPLIIHTPKQLEGVKSNALVSLVDLYPTLCDLTNIDKPAHLQGNSLTPILSKKKEKVSDYIFSRWEKGETVITERYAYTQYYNKAREDVVSVMLYDHKFDPEENNNIAGDPKNTAIVNELKTVLENHIKNTK